jgi:rhamnogalacturonyl hydrolase YesR
VLINLKISAQCNVKITLAEDSSIHYMAQKEKIYNEEDYQNGVFFSSIQLSVWQHPSKKTYLQFHLYALVAKQGNAKPELNPRKITFKFTDNSSLNLTAETIQDPRQFNESTIYVCEYTIDTDIFKQFTDKSISEITVLDNRIDKSFTCKPYPDLLKEQASCILKLVVKNQ